MTMITRFLSRFFNSETVWAKGNVWVRRSTKSVIQDFQDYQEEETPGAQTNLLGFLLKPDQVSVTSSVEADKRDTNQRY